MEMSSTPVIPPASFRLATRQKAKQLGRNLSLMSFLKNVKNMILRHDSIHQCFLAIYDKVTRLNAIYNRIWHKSARNNAI